ncbi:MAG: DUF4397 domain-containing protein [Myroides sp.]|jgi:hypothetical protein|nr:DUF4397 domain-containing protein [Myroides sp.]
MKRVLSFLPILFLSLFLFSCSSDDNYIDVSNQVGGFTMVNAYEGSDAVIYAADGRAIQNPYYPMIYRSVGYINLWSGTRFIEVFGFGESRVLANKTQKILPQQFYTSFIGGGKSKPIHFITEDVVDKINPREDAKQSGIRFFNLSSDEVVATVEFNGKALVKEFENRVQDNETTVVNTQRFNVVDSNTYTISIKDKDGKEIVKRENIVLEPSKFYSIMLTGSKNNANKPYYVGVVNQLVK